MGFNGPIYETVSMEDDKKEILDLNVLPVDEL